MITFYVILAIVGTFVICLWSLYKVVQAIEEEEKFRRELADEL